MRVRNIFLRIALPAAASLSLLSLLTVGAVSVGRVLLDKKAEAAEAAPPAKQGKHVKGGKAAAFPQDVRPHLRLAEASEENGRLVQTLDDGTKVTYTLRPKLQKRAAKILGASEAVGSALVLVEVRTGKILALAEQKTGEYEEETQPVYFSARSPAASLFKIVTASALLEKGAADAATVVCYHGGMRQLYTSNLEDDPAKDKACVSLAYAMGKSLNAVFAKLADRSLSEEELEEAGRRFGFGQKIALPYAEAPQVSSIDIPEDRLEFARAAAGFWHTFVTPLHAAFIAQAVANGGTMLSPILVEKVESSKGKVVWKAAPSQLMQCTDTQQAGELTEMMMETVTRGTASKHFYDPKGTPYLPGIEVAGKTGSLSQKTPYRFYSWFIGFAPAGDPQVAVASLVVNGQQWKMKGASLAMELLRLYFDKVPKKKKP